MAEKSPGFTWAFQRLGGLDQVVLRNADDLNQLRGLDPKLWVALSCPAAGLQFDARTLALIDTDKDGRIRIPEVADAVEWICARLKDPGTLRGQADVLSLDDIADDTEEGRRLVLTATAILKTLGKSWEDGLNQDDVTRAVAHASEQTFNGDGVVPPLDEFDADIRDFIKDAMAVIGGVEDASGQNGVNKEIAAAFVDSLNDWVEWRKTVNSATASLGQDAPEAWELLGELKDKIDDYFLRCELAAYAPDALDKLGIDETLIAPAEKGLLASSHLTDLPLSRVEADRPLDMHSGVNPSWREKLERFAALIRPLLPAPGTMRREDWLQIQKHFEPYAEALAKKPEPRQATTTLAPSVSIAGLGEERVDAILAGDTRARFDKLADKDAEVPAAAADIARVERLVLYHRHLYRLLTNFVNFEEFYSMDRGAAFQSGRLYIDGRCCRLCMPADKVDEHSALAANSQLYLLYCECTRAPKANEKEPSKTTVVAAVTAGDSDLLMQNRNGVYVDNNGEDWDATVVKTVSNPIGLWEAVWSPYKRLGSMVADQIAKFAGDKQSNLMTAAGQKLEEAAAQTTATPPAGTPGPTPAPAFDIGKSVGIFAAVGLALGAIGTAVGSIANAVFGMSWWQFPLLLGGLFAIVSGPSLVLAWLKLRKRTLGPLLEASGWAVNGRVKINYSMSHCLTASAVLPPGSHRTLRDPLARNRRWQKTAFWLALLAGALAVLAWVWWSHRAQKFASPFAASIEAEDKKAGSGKQNGGPRNDPVTGNDTGVRAASPAATPTPPVSRPPDPEPSENPASGGLRPPSS